MDPQGDGLPSTDPELVQMVQAEYNAAFHSGGQAAIEESRFRLVWAMVHCTDLRMVARGVELAKLKLAESKKQQAPAKDQRELLYLYAVGCYRQGKYVEARRSLKEVLLVSPDFRQAETLQAAVDDKILREGLLGVGVGAAVLGVGLAILFSSGRK